MVPKTICSVGALLLYSHIGGVALASSIFDAEEPDDSPVIKGKFNYDSSSTFATLAMDRSRYAAPKSFSMSLELPDVRDNDSEVLDMALDCMEKGGEMDGMGYYVCNDENRRRLLGKQVTAPPTKAFFGMNGKLVSGVIESSAYRYEIVTNYVRDKYGEVIDVEYGYAGARPQGE